MEHYREPSLLNDMAFIHLKLTFLETEACKITSDASIIGCTIAVIAYANYGSACFMGNISKNSHSYAVMFHSYRVIFVVVGFCFCFLGFFLINFLTTVFGKWMKEKKCLIYKCITNYKHPPSHFILVMQKFSEINPLLQLPKPFDSNLVLRQVSANSSGNPPHTCPVYVSCKIFHFYAKRQVVKLTRPIPSSKYIYTDTRLPIQVYMLRISGHNRHNQTMCICALWHLKLV